MFKQTLALVGLTLSLSANSATLVVSGGQLMGATGVDVGGTSYNVSFLDGSCDSLFSGCTSLAFTTLESAHTASNALLSQVFQGVYGGDPTLTNGVESSIVGYIYTPYSTVSTNVNLSIAVNQPGLHYVYNASILANADTTGATQQVYAVWSPSPVPLPATAWLFGSALMGLGIIKRKKA
ncbi:MAG: VPLPA-CTERM sorting domain-containing protein [Methylomonas lenta]|nr:VPLPA-CTERM sorting domain-containing protein [Methylomonas lenta]